MLMALAPVDSRRAQARFDAANEARKTAQLALDRYMGGQNYSTTEIARLERELAAALTEYKAARAALP